MSGKGTAAKPKYRFCWACNRQLRGNFHRVCVVDDHEVIVHADCARRHRLEIKPEAHVTTSKTRRDPDKKCSTCGGGIYIGQHYGGCPKERKAKHKPGTRWGVFPWSYWDNANERVVTDESRGYVAREISPGTVPYGRMTPVHNKTFASEKLANKLADKMTFGNDKPSRDRPSRRARRDVARSPTPRRRPTPPSRPYRLERLTAREFATLEWLADRGYDGDLLRLAGVDDEAADGSIRLGALTEAEAWQFNENVEEDPHAFLSSNGSASLREKMYRLLDAIV